MNKHRKRAQHHSMTEKCTSKPQWNNHLPPTWMTTIKPKTQPHNLTSVARTRMGRNGTIPHCQRQHHFTFPPWKIVWWFFKVLNVCLPYGPAIPLVGISPKRDLYSVFTAAPSREHLHTSRWWRSRMWRTGKPTREGKPKPHYNVDETDAKRCQLRSVSSAVQSREGN